MASVEFARAAIEDLDRLIEVLHLPANTRDRVRRVVGALANFPHLGPALQGDWEGFRFLLGPWRWMIIVYAVLGGERVVVVTIQDGRSAISPTT